MEQRDGVTWLVKICWGSSTERPLGLAGITKVTLCMYGDVVYSNNIATSEYSIQYSNTDINLQLLEMIRCVVSAVLSNDQQGFPALMDLGCPWNPPLQTVKRLLKIKVQSALSPRSSYIQSLLWMTTFKLRHVSYCLSEMSLIHMRRSFTCWQPRTHYCWSAWYTWCKKTSWQYQHVLQYFRPNFMS